MNSFIIFFLGLVGGTLVAVGVELARSWYNRPRLMILDDMPEEGLAISCHAITIRNDGRGSARECTGNVSFDELIASDVLADGEIQTVESLGVNPEKFDVHGSEVFLMKPDSFRVIRNELVAWSRIGNPIAISLFTQTSALLDVCRYMKGENPQIHIPSERGWKAVRVALKPRVYRMTVTVTAENAKSVSKTFNLIPSVGRLLISPL